MKKKIRQLASVGFILFMVLIFSACGRTNDAPETVAAPTQAVAPTVTPATAPATTPTPTPEPAHVENLPIGMDPASLLLPRLERPERFTHRDQNSFPAHWNPHGLNNTNVQVVNQMNYNSLRFTKVYAPNRPGETFGVMNVAALAHTDITATFEHRERFGIPDDIQDGLVYTIDIRQGLRWNDGTPINAHSWERSMQLLLHPEMQNHGGAAAANTYRGAREYREGTGAWEDVGVFASGDYQLTIVLHNWTNMFDFRHGITGDWLVHEEMYMAGMTREGDLLVTNYNTTIETSRFAGPFQKVVAELDRQIVMERNPYWFGWTDPDFDDFYHMTHIIIDVIPEHATRMMLFNQGLLDRILLGADDFETYRFSDRLVQWETTNLFRFIFNTNLEHLRQLEADMGDGYNRQVLSLRNFRRALSFAIDRTRFTQLGTPGHAPSVVLMENYFYNFTNDPNSRFRENEHALRAIVDFYEMSYGPGTPFPTLRDAYQAITGYNVHMARELLQEAYEEAVALGIYTPGQPINIQLGMAAGALTPTHMRQQDLLREMFADAAIGTGFEGNLTITLIGNFPQQSLALIEGRLEARNGAWGGSIFGPIGLMGVYVNTVQMGGINNINESAGWDPREDTLTLTFDFLGTGTPETRTKSFEAWHQSITGTGEFVADEFLDTRIFILANIEAGVLGTFQTIPHSVQVQSILVSHKIEMTPGYYHPMFSDTPGTRSQIRFNFTDDAWDEFVAAQGGTLNYE